MNTMVYAGAGAVIAFAILFLLIKKSNNKKKLQKERQNAVQRLREDALDNLLLNPEGSPVSSETGTTRRPFEVSYSVDGESGGTGAKQDGMLKLTERTELSNRQYMFRRDERMFVGFQHGKTAILMGGAEAERLFCEIFFYQKDNYIRNLSNEELVLKRKGKRVLVGKRGLKLRSGDCFIVEKNRYVIDLVDVR